jgi:hypothetical protein
MSFLESVRERVFKNNEPTLLPQYFKNWEYSRYLTPTEEKQANACPFEVCVSGQKVYIYERTHIPASNPVKRLKM